MPRFLVPAHAIEGERISLTGSDVRHVRNVLRLGMGDVLDCSLPDGRWARAEIVAAGIGGIEARLLELWTSSADPTVELVVAQALLKSDAMDRIVRGLSEIGATALLPMIATRSIGVPPVDRRKERIARWRRIADESCKQCGRTVPLRVAETAALSDWLSSYPLRGMCGIVLSTAGGLPPIRNLVRGGGGVVLAVGPEGGFTTEEEQAFRETGAELGSLGPRTLRCETAALVGAALALEAQRPADETWRAE